MVAFGIRQDFAFVFIAMRVVLLRFAIILVVLSVPGGHRIARFDPHGIESWHWYICRTGILPERLLP